MSLIGKNIKKIRMVKKMSQAEFARLFSVARPSIGAYEEGRAEPKIDTVIAIAKHFGISIDALLTKEITINELLKFKILDKNTLNKDPDTRIESTPYIAEHMIFDYIVHHRNKDFINELPRIHLPFLHSKKSRAFQVSGSEMKKDEYGIQHKDILVCTYTDPRDLIKDKIYVLVSNNGIAPKKFVKEEDTLHFSHENKAYEDMKYKKEDVLECWRAEIIISSSIPVVPALENRVDDLEDQLKNLMDKLMKK